MLYRCLSLCAVGALLAGCAAEAPGPIQGYSYHDGNHPNDVSAHPSPQAIENAARGTWLWPPAVNNRPGV
jgi:hypothetical protein